MILLIQKSDFDETGPWTDIKVPDKKSARGPSATKVESVEDFADRVRDAGLAGLYRVVCSGEKYIVEVKKAEHYESTIRVESE